MYRTGTISQAKPAEGLYKVQFAEDDLESGWLHLVVKKTLKDSSTHALDVGEHVACLMDEHCERGAILGAIYSESETPKNASADIEGTTFSDGTRVSYDRSSHTLTVDVQGGNITIKTTADVLVDCVNATVKASAGVKLDTPRGEVTGDWKVGGNLTIVGTTTGGSNFQTDGSLRVRGDAEVLGEVSAKADTVRLSTHTHPTPAGPSGPGLG
jgi:phage baseplate assembly protein V